VHSPLYLEAFRSSLSSLSDEPCLFLFAGDIVERGRVEAAGPVFEAARQAAPSSTLVAVFGNEEYHDREDEFRRAYPWVDWLDDEYRVYECAGQRVAVVGTRGALARPTSWQRRNMPWLERVYRERPVRIARLLDEASREADIVILLSHYALARATIKGEDPRVYPYLYSPAMERVVREARPHAAVHGHAHKGTPRAVVSGVPVYNVAFPLNRRPVRVRPRVPLTLL